MYTEAKRIKWSIYTRKETIKNVADDLIQGWLNQINQRKGNKLGLHEIVREWKKRKLLLRAEI